MYEAFHRLRRFLVQDLWKTRTSPGRAVRLLQMAVMIAEGFVRDHLMLRASALTYFTVLALVPLLAVAISIVGSLGVGSERLAELIVNQIAAGSPAAQRQILHMIENVNFRGLGTLGATALFLTTVLGISNVESALNGIWGVRSHRSWGRRIPDYLAVLIVGPLLLGLALSLATTFRSQWLVQQAIEYPFFATLYDLGLQQAPLVLLCLALAFLNWFLPNTSVRLVSALLGGVVSGVLIVLAQRLYLDLSVGVARANALFGGFAALPLLFVWIYFFWAIVLFGAELAFAHQNLALYQREVRGPRAGPAEREAIGLRIALEIARSFRDGHDPWTADELADGLHVPVRTVRDVLSHLQASGILSTVGNGQKQGAYQLGRPVASVRVTDVLRALRGPREPTEGRAEIAAAVDELLARMSEGAQRAAGDRSLAEVLDALPGAAPAPADGEARDV